MAGVLTKAPTHAGVRRQKGGGRSRPLQQDGIPRLQVSLRALCEAQKLRPAERPRPQPRLQRRRRRRLANLCVHVSAQIRSLPRQQPENWLLFTAHVIGCRQADPVAWRDSDSLRCPQPYLFGANACVAMPMTDAPRPQTVLPRRVHHCGLLRRWRSTLLAVRSPLTAQAQTAAGLSSRASADTACVSVIAESPMAQADCGMSHGLRQAQSPLKMAMVACCPRQRWAMQINQCSPIRQKISPMEPDRVARVDTLSMLPHVLGLQKWKARLPGNGLKYCSDAISVMNSEL